MNLSEMVHAVAAAGARTEVNLLPRGKKGITYLVTLYWGYKPYMGEKFTVGKSHRGLDAAYAEAYNAYLKRRLQ